MKIAISAVLLICVATIQASNECLGNTGVLCHNQAVDCSSLGCCEDTAAPLCYIPDGPAEGPPEACDATGKVKQECGFPGIDRITCLDRSCCWKPQPSDDTVTPWCFFIIGDLQCSDNTDIPCGYGTSCTEHGCCEDTSTGFCYVSDGPADGPPGRTCDASSTDKVDCGVVGTTRAECLAKGCCWKTLPPDEAPTPWCFYSTEGPPGYCGVAASDKQHCGDGADDLSYRADCLLLGCCWNPTDTAAPWCFHPDNCISQPCQNGATCVASGLTFTCTCLVGFTGSFCETNIDECASDPCLNGGQCVDGINEFSCACAAGFTGKICETNMDECASEPCLNGGECVDAVNDFICTCPAGFTGKICETMIPPASCGVNTGVYCAYDASNSSCVAQGCCQDLEGSPDCYIPDAPDGPAGLCTAFDAEKVTCGDDVTDWHACRASGCCWKPQPQSSPYPWCFSPTRGPGGQCDTRDVDRVDCGAVEPEPCLAFGCCWRELPEENPHPACFFPNVTGHPTCSVNTGVYCAYDSERGCATQGCCPDTEASPDCYIPDGFPEGPPGLCTAPDVQKDECGHDVLDRDVCIGTLGCCWKPQPQGSIYPWCFVPDLIPSCTQN